MLPCLTVSILAYNFTQRVAPSTTLAQACSQCLASWSHANRIQTTATVCGENYRQHEGDVPTAQQYFPD